MSISMLQDSVTVCSTSNMFMLVNVAVHNDNVCRFNCATQYNWTSRATSTCAFFLSPPSVIHTTSMFYNYIPLTS